MFDSREFNLPAGRQARVGRQSGAVYYKNIPSSFATNLIVTFATEMWKLQLHQIKIARREMLANDFQNKI
jgi:hypothetical protein